MQPSHNGIDIRQHAVREGNVDARGYPANTHSLTEHSALETHLLIQQYFQGGLMIIHHLNKVCVVQINHLSRSQL